MNSRWCYISAGCRVLLVNGEPFAVMVVVGGDGSRPPERCPWHGHSGGWMGRFESEQLCRAACEELIPSQLQTSS